MNNLYSIMELKTDRIYTMQLHWTYDKIVLNLINLKCFKG